MTENFNESDWYKEWIKLAKKDYHNITPVYKWVIIIKNNHITWKYIKLDN